MSPERPRGRTSSRELSDDEYSQGLRLYSRSSRLNGPVRLDEHQLADAIQDRSYGNMFIQASFQIIRHRLSLLIYVVKHGQLEVTKEPLTYPRYLGEDCSDCLELTR